MEKKTFVVDMGREAYLIAIMNHMGWREIDRVASGGYMSNNHLMLTFEGDKEDYNDDWYIVAPNDNGGFNYYSVLYPDGYYQSGNDESCVQRFKEVHDKRRNPDFRIQQFKP